MITSIENPAVKNIIALREKGKLRREKGLFLAEGPKMVSEIPEGYLEKLYVSEEFEAEGHTALLVGKQYELVSGRIFSKISDTQTPQGILAVVRQRRSTLEELLCAEKLHILMLEDIQDPGNLGTILRTSEGAGVTGVVASRGCADIYSPKTVRSTMGAVYRVPFVCVENFHNAVEQVKKRCSVYAAHLQGKCWYDEGDYTGNTAILIGNESKGLREETAALADTWIKIPMMGRAESLNAATAASILTYEVYRQRRNKNKEL